MRQAPAPAWMAASNGGSSAAKSDVIIALEFWKKAQVRPAGGSAKEACEGREYTCTEHAPQS